MKHIYFTLFFCLYFLSLSFHTYAQNITIQSNSIQNERNCGTDYLHQQMMQNSDDYAQQFEKTMLDIEELITIARANQESGMVDGEVITIPVVFHVVHTGEPVGTYPNLSEQQILDQITQLNLDFRATNPDISNVPAEFAGAIDDLEIEFCLAVRDPDGNATTGINRYDFGQSSYTMSQFNSDVKPITIWDRDSYMNFWTCETLTSPQGNLLGYAQFPGGSADTDGVVCIASSVGSIANPNPEGGVYSRGRTATHEIGHWLSLYHIWGDDNGSCTGSDEVDDTPNQGGNYLGEPLHPEMSCGSNDMFMNYMDYVNDISMYMFTFGQQERTSATLTGFRASLQNSLGCEPLNGFRIEEIVEQVDICSGENAIIEFELIFDGTYSGTVDFTASDLPSGTTGTFSQNSANTEGTYTLTISSTGSVSDGNYAINITGDDGIETNNALINLVVSEPVVGNETLIAPSDGANDVEQPVILEWTAATNALEYIVEVSEESSFSTVISTNTTTELTTSVSGLVDETEYFWRVIPQNNCGQGITSSVFSFRTALSPNCFNAIIDGGFDESITPNPNWSEYSEEGNSLITDDLPNTGNFSAQLGNFPFELSIIWQTVSIPSNATIANLHYFYSIDASNNNCNSAVGGIATIDVSAGSYTTGYLNYGLCSGNDTNGAFIEDCLSLLQFAGETINIGFYANSGPTNSSLYIDDISLEICTDPQETIPTDTNEYVADYEMTDAAGWTHYIDNNETPCNYLDDFLLLSIQKDGENIGEIGDTGFDVTVFSNPTSTQISSDYNSNSNEYFSFNRYWNVSPVQQPNAPIKVRQYFAQNDIDGLEAAIEAVTGNDEVVDLTTFVAWKLNDINNNYDVNPANGHPGIPLADSVSEDGLYQYALGSNSSTTEYEVGLYPSSESGPFWYSEFEVALFSGGGFANPQALALPVEFANFTAEAIQTDALLNWVTATENGNKLFEVERSYNGEDFETVISIPSLADENGFSQSELNYQFTDRNAAILGNHIYYRLKQIDYDQEFSYSDIRLVDFSNTAISTQLFPNPAQRSETVIVQADKINELTIITATGEVVLQKEFDQAVKSTSISTEQFSSGVYFVTVNKKQTLKLVIQ